MSVFSAVGTVVLIGARTVSSLPPSPGGVLSLSFHPPSEDLISTVFVYHHETGVSGVISLLLRREDVEGQTHTAFMSV